MKLGKLCKKILYPDTYIIIESNGIHTDSAKVSDFLEMIDNHVNRKEIFRIKVKNYVRLKPMNIEKKGLHLNMIIYLLK